MTRPVLSIEGLYASYGENVVLEDINLTVEEGEIVSIVGPNGSGKSTLLRSVLGFVPSVRGEVRILGRTPLEARKSGLVGYLPQNISHETGFPVRAFDIVAMSRYAGKPFLERLNSEDREIIGSCLEKVEADDLADRPFGSLSGGQKQRVLIARALAIKPRILLLDEPSVSLDVVAQDNFYQLLVRLRDLEGLAIIMVSHDIGSVSGIVDRLACLKTRIHFHGSPKDCIPSETLEKVFGKDIYFVMHDSECDTCRRSR